MYAIRRGGCKCWLKHDQAPIAGVTLVVQIITDKQEMRTLSRDNERICVKENILNTLYRYKVLQPNLTLLWLVDG